MANDQSSDDSETAPIDDVWGGQMLIDESRRRIDLSFQLRRDPAYRAFEYERTGNLPPSWNREIEAAIKNGTVTTLKDGKWDPDPGYKLPSEPLDPPNPRRRERE